MAEWRWSGFSKASMNLKIVMRPSEWVRHPLPSISSYATDAKNDSHIALSKQSRHAAEGFNLEGGSAVVRLDLAR